jgi:hypothetical protein
MTEHAASFLSPPREYEFVDAVQLLRCVARLCDGLVERVSAREKGELLGFVRDRLAAQDPEWVAGLKVFPTGPRWLDLVGA